MQNRWDSVEKRLRIRGAFEDAEGDGTMTDPQIEGVTLAQRLTQGPRGPEKALDILEQLLSSLAVSHDAGTIHGNISPQKIILKPDGKATLTGFPGPDAAAQPLGRFAKGAAEPAYVAPEQVQDDPISKRTDLYSLAGVGYAMLTGKDPFGGSEGVAADNIFCQVHRARAALRHLELQPPELQQRIAVGAHRYLPGELRP